MKLPAPALLVVTDRRQARAPLPEILDAAFSAGCRWASVREKDLPAPEQVALAQSLLPIARSHGASLTLHGSAELARTAGVDGVHLPADGDPAQARAVLGPDRLVGISVHRPDEAVRLDPALVDYAIAGPAFATASKPGYGPFLGAAGIAAMCAAGRVPVIGIGGIDLGNAATVLRAGAAGIAVMGGVMRAAEPGEAIRALLAAMRGVTAPSGIR